MLGRQGLPAASISGALGYVVELGSSTSRDDFMKNYGSASWVLFSISMVIVYREVTGTARTKGILQVSIH